MTKKAFLSFLLLPLSLVTPACSPKAPPPTPSEAKAEVSAGSILRLDPAFDELVPRGARIEKVADGFGFIEGPLWRQGSLLFSDVHDNVVRQWSPDGKVIEILKPGGGDPKATPPETNIGPNGIVADKDGAVLICQHGNRRIARLASDGKVTTFLDKYQGKRFNSPNDMVFKSDGSLYFTDPPYGLAKEDGDPAKELPYNGVYHWHNGKLTLLTKELTRPNGIALSPDEKTLYVSNSDEKRKIWMRYDVAADGSLKNGSVLLDATADTGGGLPDGMKVDSKGNLYASGPGGVWVFSAAGKHIGTIKPAEVAANCAWGDDGKSLYITASTGLYRIKLNAEGPKVYTSK